MIIQLDSRLRLFPLLLALGSSQVSRLHKVQLTETQADIFGARCLDGSAYAFYTSHPLFEGGSVPRDWVVYLNGGGECVTARDCVHRATKEGDLGSSIGLPDRKSRAKISDGITAPSPQQNPHFASFGTIYLPYCSGDDWLATMRAPCNPWRHRCTSEASSVSRVGSAGGVGVDTGVGGGDNKVALWFAGHNNFAAAMNLSLWSLATVGTDRPAALRSVLLSGGSAGGQGSYFHSDFVADKLRSLQSNASVLSNPQYGVFTVTNAFKDWQRGVHTNPSIPYPSSGNPTGVPAWLANVSVFLPRRCVDVLSNAEKKGPFGELLCGLAQRVAQTIEVPLFMSLNLFDAWLTGIEQKCCGPFGGAHKIGPTRSADPHFEYLMSVTAPAVRIAVHNATDGNIVVPSARARNGAFVPACIDHGMEWNELSAPVLGGCNQAAAVASWFFWHTNGGNDWNGLRVRKCRRVLISSDKTADELRKLKCNKGTIRKTEHDDAVPSLLV